MTSITLKAPAKVNLFLKILNRRKDSYHNILTLFEKISLADEIRISKIQKGVEIFSDKFITRDPKDNLAFKAAKLIMSKKRLKAGVRISIKKRIPIAAGMGGGSSDAASVLVGMNMLFKLRFGKKKLTRLAGQLGADCPFFISNTPFAVGKLRGDVLERAPSTPRLWHLIIYPGLEISARDAYEAFDAAARPGSGVEEGLTHWPFGCDQGQVMSFCRPSTPLGTTLSLSKGRSARLGPGSSHDGASKDLTMRSTDDKIRFGFAGALDFDTLESMLHNDLQDTVAAKEKAVGKIIRRLASLLGKRAIVSGSGPSVFCLFRSRKEAMKAKDLFVRGMPAGKRKDWQIFVAETI